MILCEAEVGWGADPGFHGRVMGWCYHSRGVVSGTTGRGREQPSGDGTSADKSVTRQALSFLTKTPSPSPSPPIPHPGRPIGRRSQAFLGGFTYKEWVGALGASLR